MEEDKFKDVRKVRITDLLGIRNDGRRVTIRCPFSEKHIDKTASFNIYPDGSYHCYGCSSNGQNSIDFLMALGASFSEAVAELKKFI